MRDWKTIAQTDNGNAYTRIAQLFYGEEPTDIRHLVEVVKKQVTKSYYYVDGDPEHRQYGNVIFAEDRVVELAFTETVPTSAAFE